VKKTAIALGVLAAGAVAWEFIAKANPEDDIITITAFFRVAPCWGTVAVVGFMCALAAHVYWR
jgi:hypothetical protein